VTDPNRPLLGEPNAPCRTCGAPLAADQRYCLQCGNRRAEARLPFLDILARQSGAGERGARPPVTETTTRTGAGAWLGRMGTNAAAVAGVACLLLALGVGVLIGGLGDGGSANAGTPQIITVGGGAVAPQAAPSTTAPPTTTTPDAGATGTTPKQGASKAGKSSAASSAKQSKATNSALKSLDSSSGGDYAKKSKKLPKTLGTGGAPPPVDKSVPAGGGSDVQSIG